MPTTPQPLTPETYPRDGRVSLAPMVVAVALVVAGFVAAALYTELHASAIDHESAEIETNALPSVQILAAARAGLRRLEAASDEFVEEPGERRLQAAVAIETARRDVERDVRSEFATEQYPGEDELQEDATRRLTELDGLLGTLRGAAERGDAEALGGARRNVRSGIERVDAAIEEILALNATQGRAEAAKIGAIRASSLRLLFGLNAGCIAFAALGAFAAVRSVRRQRTLELAQEKLIEARAIELERFASRVAHDLLSPLSALHFTLSTLERNAERGLSITEPIERARACLKRSQSLVDGVMDFARSGASASGGRAHLRSILDGVLEEARTDSDGILLSVEGVDEDLFVACSAGVLASVLSNIVRNAVKYLAGRSVKKVTVRASVHGSTVRVEVEDTGPGLPPGLERHVFEPYVRSPDNPLPGLGLGLATVQRFVESHRGRVGVDSSSGEGCVFWFELPRAGGLTSP